MATFLVISVIALAVIAGLVAYISTTINDDL